MNRKAVPDMPITSGATSELSLYNDSSRRRPVATAICPWSANPIGSVLSRLILLFVQRAALDRTEFPFVRFLPENPGFQRKRRTALETNQRDGFDPFRIRRAANVFGTECIYWTATDIARVFATARTVVRRITTVWLHLKSALANPAPHLNHGQIIPPYMGSGPIAQACHLLGRRYIGIELEETYCEAAVRRLQQAVLPLVTA